MGSLEKLFDHIRMLDADTYPHAFIEHGDFRLEITNVNFEKGYITGNVTIKKHDEKGNQY